MYNSYENESTQTLVFKIVGLLALVIAIAFLTQSCNRNMQNMTQIKDGYCYENDTKIIYMESESGRYGLSLTYTPYYSENGNLYKYDEIDVEWIEIKENE